MVKSVLLEEEDNKMKAARVMLAAMVAVVTAADVHADAAEWERTTAESRPQMPSAKTREKWRAERKSPPATAWCLVSSYGYENKGQVAIMETITLGR